MDRVSEVLDIRGDSIEDAPSFGAAVNTDFILGMGKAAGRVTILLDIGKLLSQSDLSVLEAAASSPRQDSSAQSVSRVEAPSDQDEAPQGPQDHTQEDTTE